MTLKLDKFQNAFIEAFEENILNFEHDFLILTGDAGTGKTELIKVMIEIANKNNVVCQTTAFTGRAAAVLHDRGIEEPITLHRWLFKKISSSLLMREYQNANGFILIIDESSMISNGYEIYREQKDNDGLLLDKLMYIFYKFIPNKNKFIVFVGDEKQLPPVLHDYSPGLNPLYIENRYSLKGKSINLKTPHRQNAKSDINVFAKHFENADSALSKELAIPQKEDFYETLDSNQVEFIDQELVTEKFFHHYFDDPNSVKIITPTNHKADFYNYDIKKRLYASTKKSFPNHLLPNSSLEISRGDILQVFENNIDKYEKDIYNGQFLVINEPLKSYDVVFHKGNKPDAYSRFPFLFQEVNVSFISDSGIQSKDKFDILISIDFMIDAYHLVKEEFSYFNDDTEGVFERIKKELYNEDIKLYPQVNFDKKINPILCKFGYALTGHKAQGGGWDYIFLDLENFWTENGHVSPKWVYTSSKRAKKKLYIINYSK